MTPTDLAAGTTDTAGGRLLVVVTVLVFTAGYLLSARLGPYGRCRRCDGNGQSPGSNRNRWGVCKRCKGSGRRERFGVRIVHKRRR
ncbi:hypothetical protein [Actinomadura sp. HBU206391]|uniref:hypothetical protein n=1 Tax=Actinomadura sp. HBU206391 TaxID=2731692 RepID=UPI00164F641C|nr:hypothetical protein [Actinomadura sp. HBU206391]MBC6456372.1 hypothetical protein [Actinomadura sp. HBU206391]